MKRFSSYLGLAAALVVLSFAMLSTDSARALAQGMKPLLVRNVDAAALRPFQAQFCDENGIAGCDPLPEWWTVPTETSSAEPVRRLVIEYVSGRCSLSGPPGVVVALGLDTTANGIYARHYFTPVVTEVGFGALAGQVTRLYADPGTRVQFIAGVNGAYHQCRLAISGHLVVE